MHIVAGNKTLSKTHPLLDRSQYQFPGEGHHMVMMLAIGSGLGNSAMLAPTTTSQSLTTPTTARQSTSKVPFRLTQVFLTPLSSTRQRPK
ncbi:hypothetical protein MJO29_016207 [Puccinia striiformis f. sp. tritici]|nr:hypothetical protein MJO29_016207 [Puccinia striiformis f. sp. tritici]